MAWDRIIGQERVKELLRRAVSSGHVAHAYLFDGPEGVGKDALAIEFARVLNCQERGADACGKCDSCRRLESLQHPDVRLIVALPAGKGEKTGDDPLKGFTDDQMDALHAELAAKARDLYHRISVAKASFIKVNSIREIRRQASMTASQSARKVFLILNAEEMNAEASNALLKTLEEPPGNTLLLLTTSRREQLLPTIVSRCQVVRCAPLSVEDIAAALQERDGVEKDEAMTIARLANGSYAAARAMTSDDLLERRREVVQFVRLALGQNRTALLKHVETVLAGRERADAERWLRLLQSWLHEAVARRASSGDGNETRDDEDVQRFVERFPGADLTTASRSVDRSIALVERNVYLPLVLTTLALDLHRSIASPSE
ncbi:MAG: DNA polymerase III subunit delta' [Ignavibacteriales bacterium]|nr:DNA polymerase III subunit delta' [Ignavibacteriales bacterium]